MKHTLTIPRCLLALSLALSPLPAMGQKEDAARHASATAAKITKLVAAVRPVGDSKVRGTVVFDSTPGGVKITAKIGGLNPDSKHAIHIHEFGDLGSDDATSAGDHFNPDGHPHALPDTDERHGGDLGNLESDGSGNATLEITVKGLTLSPGPRCILGRAIIVHAKEDDGGQPSGNAGDRIGAGVIGISKDAVPKETPAGSAGKDTRPTEPDTPADNPGDAE